MRGFLAEIYAQLEAFNRRRIIRVALAAIDDENDLERVQDPNEIKNSPSRRINYVFSARNRLLTRLSFSRPGAIE
jgi:hypothetical protein